MTRPATRRAVIAVLALIAAASATLAQAQQSPLDAYVKHTVQQPTMPLPVPAGGHEVHALVDQSAARHGLPRLLWHAVIKTESNYRCSARSPAGAKGIAQVMTATARAEGVHGNLFDCAVSLEAGARYLRRILDYAGGVSCSAISLYERGLAARPRCTAYGRAVLARMGG